VYSTEKEFPARTLRTSREGVAEAAQRLVDGHNQSAVGPYQPGKYRVVVDVADGAPRVTQAQSSFDRLPVAARPFCASTHCELAAPPGILRKRFDETMWSGPLEKRLTLDKDVRVTVKPGRRYWAKYTGMGLMGTGIVSVGVVMITGVLEKALADGICSAVPTSGPDSSSSCGDSIPMSRWQGIALGGGAGAVAVGAFLYLVVHKKPRINVAPLGGVGLAF
jgi:hypothetical protein